MVLFKNKKFLFILFLLLIFFCINLFNSEVHATAEDTHIVVNLNGQQVDFNVGTHLNTILNADRLNVFTVRADNKNNLTNGNTVYLNLYISTYNFYVSATYNSTSSSPRYIVFACDDNKVQNYYYYKLAISFVYNNDLEITTNNIKNVINNLSFSNLSYTDGVNTDIWYNMVSSYTDITTFPIGSYFDFYNMTTFRSTGSNSYNQSAVDNATLVTRDGGSFYGPTIVYPYFVSGQDFSSGNFDDILIVRDYSFIDNVYNGKIYLHIAEVNYNAFSFVYYYENIKDIDLSNYYTYFELNDEQVPNIFISVPYNDLAYNFVEGKTYMFLINNASRFNFVYTPSLPTPNEDTVYDVVTFTVGNDNINISIYNSLNNFYNTMFDNNVDSSTNSQIDSSLNYNNSSNADGIATGFFSQITTKFTSMLGYNLNEDTVIRIPLRNSYIELHSNSINTHIPDVLKGIITMFWAYIFGFYLLKFILKIYRQVKTGNILENFDTSGESITTTML